ncbi:aminoglycoside phosphotransferase family protein [Lacrimispora sp.]|uniref:aminoglycoside phosphotransferase family protein n=1 Tax=Lacrimispora sp. TaxID=2719234 RepID=UPI002FDB45F2
MDKYMDKILYNEYGIRVQSLQQVPAGWSASAWKVHSDCGDYFLKVYDKHKPSTKSWVARIDSYMPVVLWLYENTKLQKKMIAPILTKDGDYKIEDSSFIYMVFPFIQGSTLCNEKLKPEQIDEIAQIISELHLYGAEIPVPANSLIENFDVSFCMILINRLKNIHGSVYLQEVLKPYITELIQAIEELQSMARWLQNSQMRYTLCHTDIHGWNLIQSENLLLIDWEGLKLAPVEADLFSFTETFFFGYAWDEFIASYRGVHKDYEINADAMHFYRLRRRLEDISEFVESILFDNLEQDDMSQSLNYLKKECELLNAVR